MAHVCLGCGAQLTGQRRKWCGDNGRCMSGAGSDRAAKSAAPVECLWCGDKLPPPKYPGNPRRYCSRSCGDRAARAEGRRRQGCSRSGGLRSHKERAAAYGVPYEPINRLAVFERDVWLCQLCQQPIDPDLQWPHPGSASLDHIVPIARGGEHTYRNVWSAHLGCNCSKGSREVANGWSWPRAQGDSLKSA